MWSACEAKMRDAQCTEAAIASFKSSYEKLISGESPFIAESDILPASDEKVPTYQTVEASTTVDSSLLSKVVVLKLNGGLGTGMGLDKAKSLLEVKNGQTFLDFTAKQIIYMRKNLKQNVRFLLMNSFSTSDDTNAFFSSKYPDLFAEGLEFVQNKVPKIDATTFAPAEWTTAPDNEWCPPGHGDLYAALSGSGKLQELLDAGIEYMFVSNSDNLGATLDPMLLTYFAQSNMPFMMECAARTEGDKKGGHLCVRKDDGQLILRESAQCSDDDEGDFQDVSKHRFFNTNNLWVHLPSLAKTIAENGGLVPLPMIKNGKTVDPKNGDSPKVFQLETAMGAAIESFAGAGAVCIPRSRFAPVKKCSDLMLLRSNAYVVAPDHTLALHPRCSGHTPVVSLDSKKYKMVGQYEALCPRGAPSLVGCTKLTVKGLVRFAGPNVKIEGECTITNSSDTPKTLKPARYSGDLDISDGQDGDMPLDGCVCM